jgi:type III secretion protein J
VQIPEVNDLTQPDKKPLPSASVLLKYTPVSGGKPPVSADEVRDFVARSVSELKKENVTVLMTEAKSVNDTDIEPEKRMQNVMGFRMEKASADSFKLMLFLVALVFLAGAGTVGFLFLRKPAPAKPARTRTGAGTGEG